LTGNGRYIIRRGYFRMTIDEVIYHSLLAIYSNDLLNDKLYLKGGQALRIVHGDKSRFSRDADFSTPESIDDPDIFFQALKTSLKNEFSGLGYFVFDFKFSEKPKIKKAGTPDFWGGWAIEFKLIENSKNHLEAGRMSQQALVPEGAASSKIPIEISEYEFCGSIERLTVGNGVDIRAYSRALMIVEKIRSLCQQHPEYELVGVKNRARDYYDIERLFNKYILEEAESEFYEEARKILPKVFEAKGVDTGLLKKIFEEDFTKIQEAGWSAVKGTVSGKTDEFDYYKENLKKIVNTILSG
jgi:predicted nucleotidyltransferase component of viral defense system